MSIEIPKSEILGRIFAISPDGRCCGSSIACPVNGTYHYVTAAHVLGRMPHGIESKIFIYRSGKWLETNAVAYYVEKRPYVDGDIDLAIVQTCTPVTDNETRKVFSSQNLMFGQDVYFLGFPYFGDSINHPPDHLMEGFPLPFIKKATLSAIHSPIVYLDGHNNPGFSGGPVVFYDHFSKRHKILGIISAYLTQAGEIKRIETSTRAFYAENSGIGIAFEIQRLVDLVKEELGAHIGEDD